MSFMYTLHPMLLNISYNRPEIKRRIDEAVGKPFKLVQRFKMGGTGSPRMTITKASVQINNLLALDGNTNTCSIELRPDGIILMFRSLLETYALVIPYYKLNIWKGDADEYSIYKDNYFVKVKTGKNDLAVRKFLKKVKALKNGNDASFERIDDM